MPISARKMDSLLVQVLGFERHAGKHLIYILRIGGRQVAHTLISHGAREIDDDLLAAMARQMRISPSQLRDIVGGELGKEDYYQLLREKRLIEG